MDIKTIFVDFSGVLYLFIEKQKKYHPDNYLKSLGISDKDVNEWERKLNLGEVNSTTYWKKFLSQYSISEDQYQKHCQMFIDSHELNQPLINFLKTQKKEFKIGLISNYHDLLRPMLENKLKIADIFDDIVISAEVKLIKPDEAIYKLALQRLQVKPQEAIFVDDLLENVQAAAQLGIHAIQFKNNEQVISEIKQLL
ncbi:MAG: HAD family phosphatase [Chloroflexi bacterium]|nr:HAD family phosphatase [Chloroflexota bacterium]